MFIIWYLYFACQFYMRSLCEKIFHYSPLLDTAKGTLADSSIAYVLDGSEDAISYADKVRKRELEVPALHFVMWGRLIIFCFTESMTNHAKICNIFVTLYPGKSFKCYFRMHSFRATRVLWLTCARYYTLIAVCFFIFLWSAFLVVKVFIYTQSIGWLLQYLHLSI